MTRVRLTLGLLAFLIATAAWSLPVPPSPASSHAPARTAAARALPMIQRSAQAFVDNRACVSCHHNSVAIIALRMAQRHGLPIDSGVLGAVEGKTFASLRGPNAIDTLVQAVALGDPLPNDSYLLMAAHASGLPGDLALGLNARRIARWQRDDGRWTTSDFRPPHSSSVFTATATAVDAVSAYMPDELTAERDTSVRRARSWLLAAKPVSTEDAAFRLMGLAWSGATAEEMTAARADLMARQRRDGGWPQLEGYVSDAYSTGEALYALREAGASPSDRVSQRAVAFLISTQARDGTWRVRTRMISPAEVSPMYFTTGFPYGKDEYLSFTGSCWALMALLATEPEQRTSDRPEPQPPATPVEPSWLRAALFGPASALGAALDAGLRPDEATAGGTTVLMASAWDPGKIRMLVGRGADVKTRSRTGVDALTVASAVPRTAASLQLLLDAGADVQPPTGVRLRRAPIVLASMAGDGENVSLLLAHGARPSLEALSEAVTYDRPDIVRALVKAGASVSGKESTGINLLHWAVITNRADVIPVLAAAGVPVNEPDDFGFTPLMYAATLDQGETGALEALLKAGADRRIPNDEGRTPLQQAQHLGHTRIAAALK